MTLYDDLGVRKDATPDEIKRAYRKRARDTHPDKPGGDKEHFQKVAKAYALLSDDTRRVLFLTCVPDHARTLALAASARGESP